MKIYENEIYIIYFFILFGGRGGILSAFFSILQRTLSTETLEQFFTDQLPVQPRKQLGMQCKYLRLQEQVNQWGLWNNYSGSYGYSRIISRTRATEGDIKFKEAAQIDLKLELDIRVEQEIEEKLMYLSDQTRKRINHIHLCS